MAERSIVQTLPMNPGHGFTVIGAPSDYELRLTDLPDNVEVEHELYPGRTSKPSGYWPWTKSGPFFV